MGCIQKYFNDIVSVYDNKILESNCNEVAFINMGTTAALLNYVLPLGAGQSISFDGKKDEMDTTRYNISFPAGTGGQVYMIRKVYQG